MAEFVDFDFTSEAFFRDPQAGVARLRLIGPAVATKFPIVGKCLGYHDLRRDSTGVEGKHDSSRCARRTARPSACAGGCPQ